jgi:hypothetical protein
MGPASLPALEVACLVPEPTDDSVRCENLLNLPKTCSHHHNSRNLERSRHQREEDHPWTHPGPRTEIWFRLLS